MDAVVLQEKIDYLLRSVRRLLPAGSDVCYLYSDDFSQLHQSIHNQLDELYPLRGATMEQDASLCLALLLGYSVSMYANPEEESKKYNILVRSRHILQTLSASSSLKEQLLTVYHELTESFEPIENF